MKALAYGILLLLLQATPMKTQPKIQKVEGFDVIGINVRTKNADEMGPNGKIPAQWQRFYKEGWPNRIPNQVGGNVLALYSNYEGDANGEYNYTIGMRVNSTASAPAGAVVLHVPAGNYSSFTTEKGPVWQVVPQAWQKIWALNNDQLGGDRAFKVDYEVYDERAKDPNNGIVDVYVGLR